MCNTWKDFFQCSYPCRKIFVITLGLIILCCCVISFKGTSSGVSFVYSVVENLFA